MSTPLGQASRSASYEVAGLPVVDGGVDAQRPGEPGALVVGAGGAHHAAAEDLAHLDDQRARRARGAGDHERLAGLGLADLLEAVPAREAGDAEHAEIGRQRRQAAVDREQRLAPRHEVLAPAEHARHEVALGEAGRATSPPGRRRARRRACPTSQGWRVGLAVVHAPAHVGIDRHEDVAHERSRRPRARARSTSSRRKFAAVGVPVGRDASRICRLFVIPSSRCRRRSSPRSP